jgi:hypothetical protein
VFRQHLKRARVSRTPRLNRPACCTLSAEGAAEGSDTALFAAFDGDTTAAAAGVRSHKIKAQSSDKGS